MTIKNISSKFIYECFLLFLIFTLILILFFNFTACETKDRVIKIGSQAVLSGEFSSYGENQMISIELAASELSPVRIGGFDYDIEVIARDDEGNAEKAFLVSQEMVEEGVTGVIGSTFDGTTKVSIPIYMEYSIPIITTSAQKTELSGIGDNFFRLIINNRQKVENIASFIRDEENPQKLILIDNRDEYSVNMVDFLIGIFDDWDMNVLRRYSIEMATEDTNILIDNLLIDDPDVVFFCGKYDELAELVTKSREAGLNSKFITETLGMNDNIFILVNDQQCLDGVIAVIPDPPPLARYSEDIKAVDFRHKFIDFVSKAEGIEIDRPGPYAPYSYDALYILIEAMEKANSVLPGDYIKELKSISYDGVVGHIEFDFKGDMANPVSTVFVIRDGAWVRYQK